MITWRRVLLPALLVALMRVAPGPAKAVDFDRIVIDNDFPGAYQVEVADVNGDKRPDVVAVGGGTCAWYENPTWKKRVVTTPRQTPSIISSATADLDGDGKAEILIAYDFAMNEPKAGTLAVASQGLSPDLDWKVEKIAPLPSIHRLRWAHFNKLGLKLVVAPIFGASARPPSFDQEPAQVVFYMPGPRFKEGQGLDNWRLIPVGRAPVLHAIDVTDLEGNGVDEILGASNLGVTRFHDKVAGGMPFFESETLVPGAPGDAPKKGASEVHLGHLKDGRRFLTTVEPWHGTDVAVYLAESLKPLKFGPRNVLDTTLKEGHALWVADVDGDGDDEIFAGYRGPGTSVLMYDHNGKTWVRTVIDHDIAAQDLRGGDLDGDGTPDVVAVGGNTHNVVWYRPRKSVR